MFILNKIKRYPGLCIITLFLIIIWFVSIKPNLFLIGWDNFSSYFNLKTNIFRTFFATWREYRGLGVASDSEAVDLFRQLLSLLLSPLLPETLLDQTYILLSLSTGVLGIYFFASYLYRTHNTNTNKNKLADVFGFIAGFFYLFNLNTTATFTFPMIMYISRYFSIPLLLFIFYSLMYEGRISVKKYCLYTILVFLISGSYITATIFITMCLALGIFGLFQTKKAKLILIFCFYLVLNAFWLLPFANYTKEKSSLIRLAPTFIGANETQLNKPKSYYSLRKQLLFYSNFFDTTYTNNDNPQQKKYFHFLAQTFEHPLTSLGLWIFPILYFFGSVFIFIKRKYSLFWMPCILFGFIFFSMKEYSLFGFIYSFLVRLTPFIDVLFRFGDTKLHMYAAFAGSLCAAYAIIVLIMNRKKIGYTVLLFIFIATLILYRDYLRGKFIGPLMYNRVPSAYFDIASQINNDKEQFRVLHLPYDKDVYWKSYSWGMVGSSFLNFMLDHPLIDKTFEPASMENAYLHKRIINLLQNIQGISAEEEKKEKASEFANLLKRVGVKYLIFDDSVQTMVASKGVVYWGDFNNTDVKEMGLILKRYRLAETVKTYTLDLNEFANAYSDLYPLNSAQQKILQQNPHSTIELLQMKRYDGPISFIDQARYIDGKMENFLETPVSEWTPEHILQDKNSKESTIYPFMMPNSSLTVEDREYKLRFDTQKTNNREFIVEMPSLSAPSDKVVQYLDITMKRDKKNILIELYQHPLPFISGIDLNQKIKELQIPTQHDPVRMKVGEQILDEKELQTVAVNGLEVPIQILTKASEASINTTNISLTNPENCFNDRLEGHSSKFDKLNGFELTSWNQSTCSWFNLTGDREHKSSTMEIIIDIDAAHNDQDKDSVQNSRQSAKPQLATYINDNPKPNMLYLCAHPDGYNDACYNTKQLFDIESGRQRLVLPLERSILEIPLFSVLLALKNTGYQEQKLNIRSVVARYYQPMVTEKLILPYPQGAQYVSLNSKSMSSFELNFPQVTSLDSFHYTPKTGGMFIANKSCSQEGGYRTFRMIGESLVSSIDNCSTDMYIPVGFDSSRFYFWTLNYNLVSGKYPKLLVSDKLSAYYNDMVSLHQGYPDVPGFHEFQKPFSQLTYQNAFGYLNSRPELNDTKSKKYELKQDAENEGVIALRSFSAQPLPTQWEGMRITTDNSLQSFAVPASFSYQHLLPSLRKVTVSSNGMGDSMLLFNEGYDRQWHIYPSLFDALFGLNESPEPVRCDGYANCFKILQKKSDPSEKTHYLFYTPERLSIIGWFITFWGVIGFGWMFIGKKASSKAEKHTSSAEAETDIPQPID